jgi:hypothetical protein
MTEAEWLACAEPDVLLEHLQGRLSERKLRLFACACCAAVWDLVTEPHCREAAALALHSADGAVTAAELQAAHVAAQNAKPLFLDANWAAAWTAAPAAAQAAAQAPLQAARAAARVACAPAMSAAWAAVRSGAPEADRTAAWDHFEEAAELAKQQVRREQADLLREVAGNPFRPVTVAESWLAWNGGTVARLARAIHDEGRFEDLPILADALEEAGCEERELLAHCRSGGRHVPGCWALDLLVTRE